VKHRGMLGEDESAQLRRNQVEHAMGALRKHCNEGRHSVLVITIVAILLRTPGIMMMMRLAMVTVGVVLDRW